jgi:hypothetical protein
MLGISAIPARFKLFVADHLAYLFTRSILLLGVDDPLLIDTGSLELPVPELLLLPGINGTYPASDSPKLYKLIII